MKLSEMIKYLKEIQRREAGKDPEFLVIMGDYPLLMKKVISGTEDEIDFCAIEIDVPEEYKEIAGTLMMQFFGKLEQNNETNH